MRGLLGMKDEEIKGLYAQKVLVKEDAARSR
jgi:hypothetical protein